MSHTPGPWQISGPSKPDNVGGRDYAVLDEQTKIIAECYEKVGPSDTRPAYANARLIAAAPELLQACKELVDIASGLRRNPNRTYGAVDAIVEAEKAIAKAEGK
jgi:hypothetical protein